MATTIKDGNSPVTLARLMADYGFTAAYIASNPALKALIDQAIKGTPSSKGLTSITKGGPVTAPGIAGGPWTMTQFANAFETSTFKAQNDGNVAVAQSAKDAQAIAATQGTPLASTGSTAYTPGGGATATSSAFSNLGAFGSSTITPGYSPATATVYSSAHPVSKTSYAPGLGPHGKPLTGGGPAGQNTVTSTAPGPIGVQAFMEHYFTAPKKDVELLQQALIGHGLLTGTANPVLNPSEYGRFNDDTQKALEAALYNVWQYNQTENPNSPTHQTIESYLSQGVQAYAQTGPPKDHTSISTTTSFASKDNAEGAFQKVTANMLGRRATASEAQNAYLALHRAELASPKSQTTTTVQDPTGMIKSSNTVDTSGIGNATGGAGAQDILDQQAAKAPDFVTYQASTNYFGALMNALGALNSAGS